jgi:ketosteroid isomerase-like protein
VTIGSPVSRGRDSLAGHPDKNADLPRSERVARGLQSAIGNRVVSDRDRQAQTPTWHSTSRARRTTMKKMMISTAFAAALVGTTLLGGSEAFAGQPVHPDCVDNAQPEMCTNVVETILLELEAWHVALLDGNIDEMAEFYVDPGAIVSIFGEFYRGKDAYRSGFLTPMFTYQVCSADFDFSATRFQVLSPDLVVQYGSVPGTLFNYDSSTIPLQQSTMSIWTRNHGDQKRPFAVAAAYYQVLP